MPGCGWYEVTYFNLQGNLCYYDIQIQGNLISNFEIIKLISPYELKRRNTLPTNPDKSGFARIPTCREGRAMIGADERYQTIRCHVLPIQNSESKIQNLFNPVHLVHSRPQFLRPLSPLSPIPVRFLRENSCNLWAKPLPLQLIPRHSSLSTSSLPPPSLVFCH
jgi:hypothetical protein